jgi:hypothetical protein
MAPLLPTNTPPPMIPPMEIITRCRARRDLESLSEAESEIEASVAFKVARSCIDGAMSARDGAQHTPDRHGRRLRPRRFSRNAASG